MAVPLPFPVDGPCGAGQPASFPRSTRRPQWPLGGCCSMVTHMSMLVSSNRLCLWTHPDHFCGLEAAVAVLPPSPTPSQGLHPPSTQPSLGQIYLSFRSCLKLHLRDTSWSHPHITSESKHSTDQLAITLFTHYMTSFIFELPCCSVSSKSMWVLSCSVETAFSHHFFSEPPPAPCSKPDPH